MMKKQTGQSHGGNIYLMQRDSGKKRILDFSASINPLGMPEGAMAAIMEAMKNCGAAVAHYPDPDATELRAAIAERYGIDGRRVIAANGSTELIYMIPRALRPETVLLTSPTFSEFQRAASLAGAGIKRIQLKKPGGFCVNVSSFIDAMHGADMAVLCNPNNPTARVLERDPVLEIAKAASRSKCVLVIDEAFMDFCPQDSLLGRENPYLIVLRSLTKFYALAGLRLGFGYFPRVLMTRIQKFREPWSVNTLSQIAGTAALKDTEYALNTLSLINKEREFLSKELGGLGLRPYPSDANYILLRCPDAGALTQRLLDQGTAVRDCSNFAGMDNSHIRVAVRSRRENRKLIDAMRKAMGGQK